MKKITIILFALLIVGSVGAQKLNKLAKNKKSDTPAENTLIKKAGYSKASILTEDFSGSALPTGWLNTDTAETGQVWTFNNPGGRTINTTSNGNGFAIIDSDEYGSGGIQNSALITPTLNFSTNTTVLVEFEHYFRAYSGSEGQFLYSLDDGETWILYQSWITETTNAALFSEDMSTELAGESTVKLAWDYEGSWGYYWAVDDISIYEPEPYQFALITPSGENVKEGTSHDYFVTIENTGTNEDNFTPAITGSGSWTYELLYYDSTAYSGPITLPAGQDSSFIVRITLPATGLTMGDTDTENITVTSAEGAKAVEGFDITTTAITPIDAPYTQNFDGVTAPEIPLGWATIDNSGSAWAWVETVEEATAPSQPNAVELYNYSSTSNDFLLITPEITSFTGNIAVFGAMTENEGTELQVGTIADPTDPATFTSMETFTLTTSWDTYTVDFSAYAGSDTYIAFRHGNTSTYDNIFVDDFSWDAKPDYDFELITPEGVEVTAGESYDYTVTIENTGVNADDFTPAITGNGSWTYGLFEVDGVTSLSTPITIASGNTSDFVVKVTVDGGATIGQTDTENITVTSAEGVKAVQDFDITTTAITPLYAPSTHNFDGVTAPGIPIGWATLDNTGQSLSKVETYIDGTAPSQPNSFKFYNSGALTGDLLLITPEIIDYTGNRIRLQAKGSSSMDLEVGTITDPADGATFTLKETITLSSSWAQYTVDFDDYAGSDNYIAFRHGLNGTYQTFYIDDVTWEEIPTTPVFEITPGTKDFGDMAIGGSSVAQEFVITNVGGGTLTIDPAISLTGTDASDFVLTDTSAGNYPVDLAMNESMAVEVVFEPTSSSGTKTANLSITDNITKTTHDIPLTGNAMNYSFGSTSDYVYANSLPSASTAPYPATYSWIDISETGTDITADFSGGDGFAGGEAGYSFNFNFPFFGTDYTNFWVAADGWISLGNDDHGDYSNDDIPSSSSPDTLIAAFWDDLNEGTPEATYAAYYQYFDDAVDYMIVQVDSVERYAGDTDKDYLNFQVIMYEDGSIKIQYEAIDPTTDLTSATVGLEENGDRGVKYTYNGDQGPIQEGMAILFTPTIEVTSTGTGDWGTVLATADAASNVIVATGHEVTIPATKAEETCNDLTIQPGGMVTIEGTMNVNNNLTIESDATGQGSLLDNGTLNIGNTTLVEQYLTSGGWWYISPQIQTANAGDDLMVDGTTYQIWEWVEGAGATINDCWQELAGGDGLSPLKGYAYSQTSGSPVTGMFTGDLNTGAIGVADNVSHTAGMYYEGFNLIGNPYPSALDWGTENTPTTGLTIDNLINSIYVRKNDGTFSTYNWSGDGTGQNGGTQYIAPGQAVWVKVDNLSTTGTYSVTNDTRLHNTDPIMKTGQSNVFRLTADISGMNDELVVGFYDKAQESFDKYDSEKMMMGSQSNPSIYTITDGYQLAINGMPANETDKVIPVGYKLPAGTVTLNAYNISDFNANMDVFLRDKYENVLIDLREENSYTFDVSESTTVTDRFELVFGAPTGISEEAAENIHIFANNSILYLNSTISGSAHIRVTDVLGRIAHDEITELNKGMNSIELNTTNGVYIVTIESNNKVYTEKVVIK